MIKISIITALFYVGAIDVDNDKDPHSTVNYLFQGVDTPADVAFTFKQEEAPPFKETQTVKVQITMECDTDNAPVDPETGKKTFLCYGKSLTYQDKGKDITIKDQWKENSK